MDSAEFLVWDIDRLRQCAGKKGLAEYYKKPALHHYIMVGMTRSKAGKVSLDWVNYSSEGISLEASSMALSLISVSSCLFLNSGIRLVDLV